MKCGACGNTITKAYWIRAADDTLLCHKCWQSPEDVVAKNLRSTVAKILWAAHRTDPAIAHKAHKHLRGMGVPIKMVKEKPAEPAIPSKHGKVLAHITRMVEPEEGGRYRTDRVLMADGTELESYTFFQPSGQSFRTSWVARYKSKRSVENWIRNYTEASTTRWQWRKI